ncbi:MAG: MFS transporter [Synergistaceae bacterium]|jgi:predicted MFS family arabinose efflux permease|nr:MFS transporter [Synergistaceae bacterium]
MGNSVDSIAENNTQSAQAQTIISRGKNALLLTVMASTMAVSSLIEFKLLPIQRLIMEIFQIDESSYGYLNAAVNYLGIIFVMPIGYLFRKVKAYISIIVCAVTCVVGGLIMTMTTNYVLFVIGRAIEGAGCGFVGLLIFSLTINLTRPERRSFMVSLMVSTFMIGQVLYMAITPPLIIGGISLSELNGGIVVIVAVCFVVLILACPKDLRIHGVADSVWPTREQTRRIFTNSNVWLLALALIAFQLSIVSFVSYQVVYLVQRGLDMQGASNVVTISSALGIVAMLVWGLLSDKLKTKRKIAIFSMLASAICMILLVKTPVAIIWLYTIWLGTLPRSIVGMTNSSAGDLAETPSDIAIVNSFISIVVRIGTVIGAILTGYCLVNLGYDTTIYILAGVALLGAVCWIFAKRVK